METKGVSRAYKKALSSSEGIWSQGRTKRNYNEKEKYENGICAHKFGKGG